MATVNQGIKIASTTATSVSCPNGGVTTTVYTVPSGNYFILTGIYQKQTGSVFIDDGAGNTLLTLTSTVTGYHAAAGGLHLGAGERVRVTNSGATDTYVLFGTLFSNI